MVTIKIRSVHMLGVSLEKLDNLAESGVMASSIQSSIQSEQVGAGRSVTNPSRVDFPRTF